MLQDTKEKSLGSYTSVYLTYPAEMIPNVEWNVNMNLRLPSLKGTKIFQRTQRLLNFVLVVLFLIAVSYLQREVRSLQVKVQCVNENLMLLMIKYDRLNRNLNRVWFHRAYDKLYETTAGVYTQHSTQNPQVVPQEIQNTIKSQTVHDSSPNDAHAQNNVNGNQSDIVSSDVSISSTSVVRTNGNNSGDRRNETKWETDDNRYKFVTDESEPSKIEQGWLESLSTASSNFNMPRVSRSRRDSRAKKRNRSSQRKSKRNRRQTESVRENICTEPPLIGPLTATFVGAVPEQHVTDTVYVGPWTKSSKNESRYNFNKFHLVEDNRSIEVTTSGLYFISTQIFYFGGPVHYSYWILLSSEGASSTQKLTKCATVSAISDTEISCHTSITLPLRKGDRLHIQQQERDRLINLREGYSYVQLVLLSKQDERRRKRW
ncbi:uncharacterized protein LOC105696689 isoform X2 [Orussus abietinus]|uniref:uncharacterized protein LOC105696689 isoform X2 n=1 Tax=Orussus abietinus TaxID=222816 RepID=UPI0006268FEF|nr:uncharacterized protein LOC105696689 isoform X2 [Orussus abietinus]